jgi:hypothetical protein
MHIIALALKLHLRRRAVKALHCHFGRNGLTAIDKMTVPMGRTDARQRWSSNNVSTSAQDSAF